MIVPMKKICIAVMDKYREDSLEKLKGVGVLHIEQKSASSETLLKLLEMRAKGEAAMSVLKSYEDKRAKKAKIGEIPDLNKKPASFSNSIGDIEILDGENPNLSTYILDLQEKHRSLQERASVISSEQSRIKNWGDFDPKDIKFLEKNGLTLHLYEMAPKNFKSLPANISYVVLKKTKASIYLAVLGDEIPGEAPLAVGGHSFSEYENILEDIYKQEFVISAQLSVLFHYHRNALERELASLLEKIEFETALAGLEKTDGVPDEFCVSYLKGYAPAGNLDRLKTVARENGWAMALYDPAPEDKPPTQLKNNSTVRIIRPLFSFLGTIPGYREYDISPSYLIFFSIFFAMIFGDAAYGVILLTVSLILGIKSIKSGSKLPDVVKLMTLLGLCTVGWGSINGAWFAIPKEHLPVFLSALIIPPFNGSGQLAEFPSFLRGIFIMPDEIPTGEFKSRWSIQLLCFTFAVIQLTWARAKRVKRLLPSLTAVAQVGWFMVVIGFYFLVLSMLLGMSLPSFWPWLFGSGIALVFIFSEQRGGNFFANIVKSLSGFFPIFLKAIGCFADVISYIRLFAVGLAGSMIGQIFNSMAVPSDGFGSFGLRFILSLLTASLILVFGHGLNLALNALSVIVHGVRLNLLEYAGNHLDMEWSGYEYKPFASRQKDEQQAKG